MARPKHNSIGSLTAGLGLALVFASSLFSTPVRAEIEVVNSNPVLTDARKLIEKHHLKLLKPGKHPEVDAAIPRLTGLLQHLLLDSEKSKKISFAIVDDMRVNAGFARVNDQESLVLINLGALRFIENDDELAFILGHELSHGKSSMDSYLRSGERDYALMLSRVVENEVDFHALLERLHRKGLNPNAAHRVLQKLEALAPGEIGLTHTTNGSRISTADISLTAISKHLGESVLPDAPEAYRREVFAALAYLHTTRFRLEREKEVARIIANSVEAKSELHATLKKEWSEVERILGDMPTYSEKVATNVRLIEKHLADIERERNASFAAGKKPKSVSELNALAETYLVQPWLNSVDTGRFHRQTEIRKKFSDERDALRAKLPGNDPKLGDAEQASRWTFLNKEISRIDRERQELIDALGARDWEAVTAQRFLPEAIHQSYERATQDRRQLLERYADVIVKEFDGDENLRTAFLLYSQLSEPTRQRLQVTLQEKYLRRVLRATQKAVAQNKPLSFYDLKVTEDSWVIFGHGKPTLSDEGNRIVEQILRAAEAKAKLAHYDFSELLWYAEFYGTPLDLSVVMPKLAATRGSNPEQLAEYVNLYWRLQKLFANVSPPPEPLEKERQALAKAVLERTDSRAGAVLDYYEIEHGSLTSAEKRLLFFLVQPGTVDALSELGALSKERFSAELKSQIETWLQTKVPTALPFNTLISLLPESDRLWLYGKARTDFEKFDFFDHPLGGDSIHSRARFVDHLLQNQPEVHELRTLWKPTSGPLHDSFYEPVEEFLRGRFKAYLLGASGKSTREKIAQAAAKLRAELDWEENLSSRLASSLNSTLPSNASERLQWLLGLDDEYRAYRKAEKIEGKHFPPYYTGWFTPLFEQAGQLAPRALAEALGIYREFSDRSAERDLNLRRVWMVLRHIPQVRSELLKPEWVRELHFDVNRIELARWQLEASLGISKAGEAVRSGTERVPSKEIIRPQVASARALIDRQFPDRSGSKNDVLEWVARTLQTNQAETALLSAAKLSEENWFELKKLASLDFSDISATHAPASAFQRLDLIRYLTGQHETIPESLLRGLNENRREYAQKRLEVSRREFNDASIPSRLYLLQSLLNEKNGVLSEAPVFDLLKSDLLGNRAGNALVRQVFDAYFGALPEPQKKVVLGKVLAEMANQPGNRKGEGASLRTLLESMGPLGIKAGQFLLSSGLGGPELRKELMGLFDRAAPPDRDRVFARLETIFGKELTDMEWVGDLVGSGSVNYVVKAKLRGKTVVLRLQRDAVEGRAKNENEVWEKAIATMKASSELKLRLLGRYLNEARTSAMSGLRAGGPEVRLEHERELYPEASQAYQRAARKAGGRTISVASPIPELQALVPKEFQSVISVYEHISAADLANVATPREQAAIYLDVMDAELDAAFTKGKFDPDAHPGNWLFEAESNRLVRIDYGQLEILKGDEPAKLRELLASLTVAESGRERRAAIERVLPQFLTIEGAPRAAATDLLASLIVDKTVISSSSPTDRLFALRDRLESELQNRGYQSALVSFNSPLQSALGLMLRLQSYREKIGTASYVSMYTKHLGISTGELAKVALARGVKKLPEVLGGVCGKGLAAVGRHVRKTFQR